MVANISKDKIIADKTLLDAFLGKEVDAKLLAAAENIISLSEKVTEEELRDILEIKGYILEEKQAELEKQKAEDKDLVSNITKNGIKQEQVGSLNATLGRFNNKANDSLNNYELFLIGRKVEAYIIEGNSISEYQNISDLHDQYEIVVKELKDKGITELETVKAGDLEGCSNMCDFKPQDARTVGSPKAAAELEVETPSRGQ